MPSDRYDVMQSQACINAKHAVIYYTLKNSNVPGFTIHKYRNYYMYRVLPNSIDIIEI